MVKVSTCFLCDDSYTDVGFCADVTELSPYGYFTWTETEVGNIQCQPCIYGSDCEEDPSGSVTRECKSDGEWGPIVAGSTCFTSITFQLQCIFAKVSGNVSMQYIPTIILFASFHELDKGNSRKCRGTDHTTEYITRGIL